MCDRGRDRGACGCANGSARVWSGGRRLEGQWPSWGVKGRWFVGGIVAVWGAAVATIVDPV